MPAYDFNLVPQTELDAVNQCLMSIGQSPVNTLAVSGIKTLNIARLHLHNAVRETLTQAWDFNSDDDYPLTPDVNGKITIPANALSVDPMDRHKRYVERYDTGVRRFYDKDTHSFIIGEAVKVAIKWFFPFEQLPQAARAYIAHRAARVFQAAQVGSTILYQFTKERENELLGDLEREHLTTRDSNFFESDANTNNFFVR